MPRRYKDYDDLVMDWRIAAHIKTIMLQRDLTQEQVGKKLGVHSSVVSRWLKNLDEYDPVVGLQTRSRGMGAGTVLAIWREFDIDGNVLIGKDPPGFKKPTRLLHVIPKQPNH